MIKDIDPVTWYSERELSFTPSHFVITNTPITNESKLWILDNLRGRFSIVNRSEENWSSNPIIVVNFSSGCPAFEDPKEAVMYELTWT